MCGIAGVLNFNNKPISVKQLVKMTEIVRHRGPDDWGIALFDTTQTEGVNGIIEYRARNLKEPEVDDSRTNYFVGLTHTRLSIIDLSERGHQPMGSVDSSLWIVYNGEVYNYIEIRKELASMGYEFKSNTDTEVILYAYEVWGADCLNRFNGMWAFVIYDRKERCLFCARDRFGVKPFYYYLDGNYFIFASEIKQILECEEYKRKPNEKLIYDYLIIGLEDHTRETFFDNIYQLKGGESAVVNLENGTFKKSRYYDLNNVFTINQKEQECYERFNEVFIDAVSLRLRSDVPVGSCLSGGLDSSAVVSVGAVLLQKRGDTAFNTFTACWKNDVIDERKYAETVVACSGANGNYIYPSADDLANNLSGLVWHQEEPFGSLSIFAQWSVMKAAREKGVSVLLDGQGGDEVFLGYERYYAWFLLELFKKGYLKNVIHELVKSGQNSKLNLKEILAYYLYFNLKWVRALRLNRKAVSFINKDFMKSYDISSRLDIFSRNKTVLDLQINEIQQIQLAHLLKYADRNSMAFSIESRYPFLDYRLVEFALSVPSKYKIREGWTKNIIREGLKGIIPEEVRKRKKKLGFDAPQAELLQGGLPQLSRKIRKATLLEKYFNMRWLLNRLKGNGLNDLIIWKALCLDLWFREFFEK